MHTYKTHQLVHDMKKKILSLKTYLSSIITILISSIIVSFISFSYAAYLNYEIHNHTITVNMDYSSYFSPSSDSNNNTYVIETAEQLNNLSKLVAMGVFGPQHTFKLGANIDYADSNEALIPIGSDDTPFYSTFDGQGYTITGLKVVGEDVADVGMFGYVGNGATIKNFLLDSPTIYVDGTYSTSSYTTDPYVIRNSNPFRKKFGADLYELGKSISLSPNDGANNTTDYFTNFTIKYTEPANDELKNFQIKTYVNKTGIVNPTDANGYTFSLNSNYSGDSQYFTIEVYIEGLIKDEVSNNYYYSRYSLEKIKVYLEVNKDRNGTVKSIGFVKDPENIHAYKKTIETTPQHIVTDDTYDYYNQHVVYAGIVVGHLDGKAEYIGVKTGTILANNRPYRSNSLLIGKKIDDDDISTLSREHVNFTLYDELGTDLFFEGPDKSKSSNIDYNTNNKYISNIYKDKEDQTGSAYCFSYDAKNYDYLKIYGAQGQTKNEKNLQLVTLKNSDTNENTKFLSFRDSMDCYHSKSDTYKNWLGQTVSFRGSKNFYRSNCISMRVTTDSGKGISNVINSLLNESGDFYLNFSFEYILFDSGKESINDGDYSKAKLKIMSSTKRKQRSDHIPVFNALDYYSYVEDYPKYQSDGETIMGYYAKTIPEGQASGNNIPGYVDTTVDSKPLNFKKEDVTLCQNIDSVTTYLDTQLKKKTISVISNRGLFKWDFSGKQRTPIFCLGLDLSECDPTQQIALNLYNFTVTLSSVNGNYSSDPLTIDYYKNAPTYADDGTWSNWPIYSNSKVSTSCFSRFVPNDSYNSGDKSFNTTYPEMSYSPYIPTNYRIVTSRSNDTNNVGVITITYTNSPHKDVIPINDQGYNKATITAG